VTATAANLLISLVAIALTAAAFYGANRATRAKARSDNRAVDAAAYARATGIYESTIAALREEIARLTAEVHAARDEIQGVRNDLTRLQAANDTLAAELTELRRQKLRQLAPLAPYSRLHERENRPRRRRRHPNRRVRRRPRTV
jgi:septal ring factor EnvC (AmiA/AmiB activator)